jgi:hypothetical protein
LIRRNSQEIEPKNGMISADPVGRPSMVQQLKLLEKDLKGKITTRKVLDVVFVPMTESQSR